MISFQTSFLCTSWSVQQPQSLQDFNGTLIVVSLGSTFPTHTFIVSLVNPRLSNSRDAAQVFGFLSDLSSASWKDAPSNHTASCHYPQFYA